MKKAYFIIILLLIITAVVFIVIIDPKLISRYLPTFGKKTHGPTNFTECLQAGYTIQKTYPRRCLGPNNQLFTEDIAKSKIKTNPIKNSSLVLNDVIQVTTPRPNSKITSPFTITGQARGSWFFEASFPVILQDANGVTLVEASAEAKDEWMSEAFVPFSVTITFPMPTTATGVLILKKDNPSGLTKNDAQLEIPVRFKN